MKSKIYISTLFVALLLSISQLNGQTLGCNAPTQLSATNITANSATLSWSNVTGALFYNVRYRLSPGPNTVWTTVTSQTTSVNVSGLTGNTAYEWQVQTGCSGLNGAITLSVFSSLSYFTTLPAVVTCGVPTGLFTNNITTTSAKVHWTSTGATSYKVRYRQTGTVAWTVLSGANNYKIINGLTSLTSYQWQVRSVCVAPNGTITNSAWSATSTFQTLGVNTCPTPTGLTSASALGGVTLTWNATGASSYNIRYRSANTAVWINTTSSTNSKQLTGLPSNGTYEWQVQGVCGVLGAVVLSGWSASSYFSTLAPRSVTPNPANDKISVSMESSVSQSVTLTIRDFYGMTFSQEKKFATEGINQFEVNVSDLKNGIYYIEISGRDGIETQKFYIQH